MKLWVYKGRHGELELHTSFVKAREHQDRDNNVTLEDLRANRLEYGGSEESGHFWIDDGGDITLVEVQE